MCRLILFVLCIQLIGCTVGPKGKQAIRLNLFSDPRTLDPRMINEVVGRNVSLMLYEGLTRIGPDGAIRLGAARSFSVSDDGLLYTFKLRKGRWSDGKPVVAADFVRTWQTALGPNFPSTFAYQLYILKNAREIKEGSLPADSLGARAIDDHTLEVELAHPAPFLLALLATPAFFPVSDSPPPPDALPIVNGPFLPVSWQTNHELYLKKNPLFWDARHVRLDSLELFIIPNENTSLLMFEKNELDHVGLPFCVLPADSIETLRLSRLFHLQEVAAIYWYRFNTTRSPLNHPKFRRALSLAIDRTALSDFVMAGLHIPATGALPHSLSKDRAPLINAHALPDEAINAFHEALSELGLSPEGVRPLELSFNHSEDHMKIASSIQQQWQQILGIQVQLQVRDWQDHLQHLLQRNFDVGRLAWQAHYPDALDFLLPLAQTHDTGWENDRYRELLALVQKERDSAQRSAYLAEAERLLIEEMPVIPLFSLRYAYCLNPRLQGVVLSELGTIDFRWAYLESSRGGRI